MYNQPVSDASLVGCPSCDLLQRLPELAPGESAHCPRCDEKLRVRNAHSLDRPLALSIAAGLLFIIANSVPMLGLSVVGRHAFTTVIGGAEHLWNTGIPGLELVAVLVLFTVVLAPGLQIGIMLVILLSARRERPPRWIGALLHYYPTISVWSMIEVMLLGVLVALIKIAELAEVIPGVALFALGGLIFIIAAMEASFDPGELWERIEWAQAAELRVATGSRMQAAPS